MKNLSRIAIFILFTLLLASCQNDAENTTEVTSETQLLKTSIDFNKLEEDFGKPDFDNLIKEENEEYGIIVYGIPFITPDFKKSVLYATVIHGEYKESSTFIVNLESTDKKFNFKSSNNSFKGMYSSYNLKKNETTFTREVNLKEDGDSSKNSIAGGDCYRGAPSPGYQICSMNQVGSCVGYKLCSMGFFESAACAFSLVCIPAITVDCQIELCWDSDPSNDYLYY